MEDDVVYVYAILDLRRDPLWIRKRFAGEKIEPSLSQRVAKQVDFKKLCLKLSAND